MNTFTKIKEKLKMLFCKHEHTTWYTKSSQFYCISGERRYKICDDCGEEISTIFVKYD